MSSAPGPGPGPGPLDAFATEMERGKTLLEQARRDSRRWSQAFVSSLLDVVKEGATTPDRSARRQRAVEVAGEFGEAAAAFRTAVALRPSRDAYVGVAEALEAQGGTFAAIGPGAEGDALASLAGAVAALDGALDLGSATDLLDSKARLLRIAAGVHTRLREWDEASLCYREAVDALDDLLVSSPAHPEALLSKATLLAAWAGLGVRAVSPSYAPRLPADPEAALARHTEALVAFDEAMAVLDAAEQGKAALWKGMELRSLGDLQRALSRRRSALESYRGAVRLFDEAVAEAPRHRSERGRTLERVGDVARDLGRTAEATWAYERGIADLVAPGMAGGYDDLSRGTMSIHVGELYLGASRLEEARAYLREGLEVLMGATGITDEDRLVRDRLINRGTELLGA